MKAEVTKEEKAIVTSSTEGQEEIKSGAVEVTSPIVEDFWDKRRGEARNWCWVMIFANSFFQISAIVNPMNDDHYWTNVVYQVVSTALAVILLASYWMEKYSWIPIIFANTVTNMRLIIRFSDFENNRY